MSDLIDRQEAEQRIDDALKRVFVDSTGLGKKILARITSIEPKQKTGTWEVQPSGEYEADFIWWKCSNCGQVIFSSSETDRRTFHAYCGRCGSKMY